MILPKTVFGINLPVCFHYIHQNIQGYVNDTELMVIQVKNILRNAFCTVAYFGSTVFLLRNMPLNIAF